MAALRRAGHRVRLLAPAAPGAALLGSGLGEVEAVLPWDAPDTARLLGGENPDGPLAAALHGADVVIAWTRSADVLSTLRARSRRVLAQDPAPPAGVGPVGLWLARPLAALGLDPVVPPPTLVFSPEETAAAGRIATSLPTRFLALHPGSGSPSKNWPPERFVGLLAAVEPDRPWLLVLGPAEGEGPPPLVAQARAVRASGLPPRVLAALLARAGLLVGNDSGVSHLAAAAGAPTLALFGPTDPSIWAPLGPAVEVVRSPDDTMAGLPLADVVEAAVRTRRPDPPW